MHTLLAPYFFGITPDPVLREASEPAMTAAAAQHRDPSRAVVFMTDGDADRLCAFTAASGYITSTEIAIGLILAGIQVEQVIATHVAQSALRKAAEEQGIDYRPTRVGFKNMSTAWKHDGRRPAPGVEPNGGLALATEADWYFERDEIANAALVLQQFGSTTTIDAAIAEVRARRPFEPRHFTAPMTSAQTATLLRESWPDPTVTHLDAVTELVWPTGWRVLVRRSGTEAITRCYAEGPKELYDWFRSPAFAK